MLDIFLKLTKLAIMLCVLYVFVTVINLGPDIVAHQLGHAMGITIRAFYDSAFGEL